MDFSFAHVRAELAAGNDLNPEPFARFNGLIDPFDGVVICQAQRL